MAIKINFSNIAKYFYEIGTLRKIPRSHMQTLMTSDLSDNIASHSFRVSIIGLVLAKLEKANTEKVLTMCLLHDTSESRSGDQNWVHKKYIKVFEEEIIKDQLKQFPDLSLVLKEYNQRKTKEAIIAKDADRLDQLLLIKEYRYQGNQEANRWGKNHLNGLVTKSAKSIGKQIMKLNPSDWWSQGGWSEKRR